jgi:hypothetical protein
LQFLKVYLSTNKTCTWALYSFSSLRSLALGLVTDGQLGCSFLDGFAVLGGNTASNLSTVRFLAHQEHLQLLDVVDQELPEATGQHVLCFLFAL